MRKHLFTLYYSILCFGLVIVLSASDPVYYGQYTPIFMERSEMENAVKIEAARPLQNPGKIYLYKNYILVNEKYKGIHIIDNSNPADPKNIAFVHIDGCIDIAIKNDIMFVDNAVDLIAIKPSADFSSIQVTERIKDIFPEIESPDGQWMPNNLNQFRPTNGILVGYKKRS